MYITLRHLLYITFPQNSMTTWFLYSFPSILPQRFQCAVNMELIGAVFDVNIETFVGHMLVDNLTDVRQ